MDREKTKQFYRQADILMELWNTIHILKDGLAVLQRSKYSNDNHYSFMLLIGPALERLYKIILTLDRFDSQGQFLISKELKSYSHRLLKLNRDVVDICQEKYPEFAVDPLKHDDNIELLKVLQEFLGNDKYLFLDNLNDPLQIRKPDPRLRWNSLGYDNDGNHYSTLLKVEIISRTLCQLINTYYLKGINVGSPMLWVFLSGKPGNVVYNRLEWGPIDTESQE